MSMSDQDDRPGQKRPRSRSLDEATPAHRLASFDAPRSAVQQDSTSMRAVSGPLRSASPSQSGIGWPAVSGPPSRDSMQSYPTSFPARTGSGSPSTNGGIGPLYQPSLQSFNSLDSKSSGGSVNGTSTSQAGVSSTNISRPGPQARQRTAVACRYCRKRKIRCTGISQVANDPRCSNCRRLDQECIYAPASAPVHGTYMRPSSGSISNDPYDVPRSFSGESRPPSSPTHPWPAAAQSYGHSHGYGYPEATQPPPPEATAQRGHSHFYNRPGYGAGEHPYHVSFSPVQSRNHTPPFPGPYPTASSVPGELRQSPYGYNEQSRATLLEVARRDSIPSLIRYSPPSVSVTSMLTRPPPQPVARLTPSFEQLASPASLRRDSLKHSPPVATPSAIPSLASITASLPSPSNAQSRSHHDHSMLALLNPVVGAGTSRGGVAGGVTSLLNGDSERRSSVALGGHGITLPSASSLLGGLSFNGSRLSPPSGNGLASPVPLLVPK
ncbi:hypothetical protein BCR37DRAFT_390651 [Protomyces lactucae-debilis]|uniref:Zn(2)-C6 fungal-type domain-containing protein n=1 Tax=Protomyces lactucae-debilis TaxID=2754530 RepID=A0A1Y2FTM2_PROLT|nr:uncharacterized protein BCR37DRAFT_390651 [Protomyces lactucae-debilis]ORY86927.1 hypothetical protein BCR37DRAFT_390651 [Protomyces lactucae-debilis]